MKNLILIIALITGTTFLATCKKRGCTDPLGTNYKSTAVKDNGKCKYSGEFTLASIAVADGELKDEYKCEDKIDGIQKSIPLVWNNVPAGTGSLAIIMEHYPNPEDLTMANCYLLLWDIDPSVTEIPYGTADDGPWYMGSNKDGDYISYTSPCSPDAGTHKYQIILYALRKHLLHCRTLAPWMLPGV